MSHQSQAILSPTARASADTPEVSGWCLSKGKRIFDLVCASLILIVALPVMGIVALVIKITSPGPVLFRQIRAGKDGAQFELLKFRTMKANEGTPGTAITRGGDSRVTSAGKVLRLFKLDELPQLFNVVRGEISLVGPRPDLPQFCAMLHGEYRGVLRVRPGITGWASIHFRNEESILAAVPEQQLLDYYVNTLLVEKARLDLEYARRASCLTDMQLLLQTLLIICK